MTIKRSSIATSILFSLAVLPACGAPEGGAAPTPAAPTPEISGPRALSDAERQLAAPTFGSPQSKDQGKQEVVDLTGFTLTLPATTAAAAPTGVGASQHALSGPISPSLSTWSGSVGQGGWVLYRFTAPISVATLRTASGDADLYAENCDGSIISISAAGGLALDYRDIYTASGISNCRQFRVRGYLASSYQLVVYNYL